MHNLIIINIISNVINTLRVEDRGKVTHINGVKLIFFFSYSVPLDLIEDYFGVDNHLKLNQVSSDIFRIDYL